MAQPAIQASFNSGEWSPKLYSRVDLEKYHSAAALLLNYFVDYRGGASTRPGSKYVVQAYKSATAVRLIPFQASQTIGYVLEFGDYYIRFINNGAPVLEAAKTITGASKANPCTLTIVGHDYNPGEWLYLSGIGGMTQLNGRYVQVLTAPTVDTITIGKILDGSNINSTSYTTYTTGGSAQRIYTLGSPYAAADLAQIKFAQNVDQLILCHPSYAPQVMTYTSAANWAIQSVSIGPTVSAPTSVSVATTLSAGTVNYSYIVTAVDPTGQESGPSTAGTLANKTDIRSVAGTNTVSWTPSTGAISYNVYRAELAYGASVPAGSMHGYIGTTTGSSFVDSNISPDYTATPPIVNNPFQGAGVSSVTITNAGTYASGSSVPTGVFSAAPSGGFTATGAPVIGCTALAFQFSSDPGGSGAVVGDLVVNNLYGVTAIVASVTPGPTGFDVPATYQPMTYPGSSPGAVTSGTLPSSINMRNTRTGSGYNAAPTWGVNSVTITYAGAGYTSAPTYTFSAGTVTATGTPVLAAATSGSPAVPGFLDQRLCLAGPTVNPQLMNFSVPGNYFNFNYSNPIQADDAFTARLVSGQLNTIKALVQMPSGLVTLTDRQAWLVNGGGNSSAISPINAAANSQSYTGCSDVPPIVSNYNILYVQAKGSIVRDMTYNFYANIWTGTDISILSSHLFYGYTLSEWAWAEEPFKVVWAVRSDGVMLMLTYLKEQELIGWAHATTNGYYKSVATVTETVSIGKVDAIYTCVQRTINGSTVQYIERTAERVFTAGVADAWCVDAGLQYTGSPATSFSGADHLAGASITGLADGLVVSATVTSDGTFTLGTAASKVTMGLAYTCDLQTLPLDPREMSQGTSQGKVKAINAVDLRVAETLGLKIGANFGSNMVTMKDLVVGNVNSMATGLPYGSQTVTGLWTGDARSYIDRTYTVYGQFCIRQDQPFPATILGVFPQVGLGDTGK